jgi:hypothetical protein
MKRSLLPPAVATLVATSICFLAPLAANAQRPAKGGTTNQKFLVIQIIDPSKETATDTRNTAGNQNYNANLYEQMYKVIPSTQLRDETKRLDEEYKKRVEEWEDKKQTDPTIPKPVKARIKTLKTFHTQNVADDYRKKLIDDLTKKDSDKPAATDPTVKPAPAK